ncbi:phage portal protein [Virgibacillus sp. Bac332]|uniref:phage portal protein n=1 Tax=Virgibacillus sp. Bac332 TaxID=2419842 RepID=UPI000EF4D243|nr:phage portal protein [Virgibacillus sp. Bac332]
MYDQDLIEDTSNRIYMKQMALLTCINLIARTISMSEFRVKNGKKSLKNEMYYRLNIKPNVNQSASTFWQQVIYKLIYDNECLIIQSDTSDLLVADTFTKVEYALYGDIFRDVVVKDFQFNRTFKRDEVIYLEYSNKRLMPIIDGLYSDYGELFGRILNSQKRKSQIRGTVDVDTSRLKSKKPQEKLQNFVNKIYGAFSSKDIAIVPQQNGFSYEEHSKETKGQSVDEVDKVTNGFLNQVARALHIPIVLIQGDKVDTEKPTRNFMKFCIDAFLKSIGDELNAQLFEKSEYLSGKRIDIKRVSYNNMFDVASAVDKLRSSGTANGHELRDELGMEESDDPIHEKYVITKNYSEKLEGGEKE